MIDDPCQRYAEDPEGHEGHLAVCERCREIDTALITRVKTRALEMNGLPLAPWEGAAYRSWPLVIAGAVVVLAIAWALCNAAGIALTTAIASGMSSTPLRGSIPFAADALRRASIVWQVGFGVAFVVINTLLVLLLRRAPRGIDA